LILQIQIGRTRERGNLTVVVRVPVRSLAVRSGSGWASSVFRRFLDHGDCTTGFGLGR
jgi:hypothetical protein